MRVGLPILTFHGVDESGSPISTPPRAFAAMMASFADGGWRTVDLDAWVAAGRPAVDRGFAITFDDGLASTQLAAEVLVRHDFVATAFLVTGRMGSDNAWPGQPRGIPRLATLTWRQAMDLRRGGVRLGAHTVDHPRLDGLSVDEIERELSRSKRTIEDRTGEPCRLVAYPYGRSDMRVRASASGHFAAGFGTRLDRARTVEDRFDLPRIDAYELRHPAALAALIAGRESRRFAARRLVRAARASVLAA